MRSFLTHIFPSFRIKLSVVLYAVFFLILVFLFDSKFLIPDSNFLINIDPKSAFSVFTHSWDSTFGFGQSNNWSAVYIFPNLVIRFVLFGILGQRVGQAVYFALPFVLGTYSMHYLLRILFHCKSNIKIPTRNFQLVDLGYFVSGLLYVSNIYFILVFVGATTVTYTHIMLPFQIGLLIKILENNRSPYRDMMFFALATLVMSGTSPPYVIVSFVVLFCVLLYQLLLLRTKKMRAVDNPRILYKLLILVITTLILNAIWILPLCTHFITLNRSDTVAAMVENPEMHNRKTTYLNVFRNLGLWAFGDGYQGRSYYNYSDMYQGQSSIQYAFFAGVIILLCSLIINRSRRLLLFFIMYILFLPLVVGTNQGLFMDVYRWSYDHVPGFAIFRGTYKFVGILVLVQSVGVAHVVYALQNRKIWMIVYIATILVLVGINGGPLWTKRLFEDGRGVNNIPGYYAEAGSYFAQDNDSYRIWLLPDQYLAFYAWAKTGANVESIWQRPLVVRLATSPEHPMNVAVNQLMQSIRKDNIIELERLMARYNIKYIVVRDDALWDYYPDLAIPKPQIVNALKSYPYVEIGRLRIYTVSNFVDRRVQGSDMKTFTQLTPSL